MFRSILVAIDGSDHAARALAEAADLADTSNATLTVMTSVPDPSAWLLGGAAYGGVDFESLKKESEREYSEMLDGAVDALPQDLSVTKVIAHGHAADRILEQREKGGHDLIVMGSRGRGGVTSLLLGSVSQQVLNGSPTAVLIVHAPRQSPDD